MKNSKTMNIVKGVIAVMLLLCLIDADYGYYQAMRTLVSFGFAYLAYQYYNDGDKRNAIINLCLLILFQPLLKIGLGREIWMFVDVAVAVYLFYSLLKHFDILNRTPSKKPESSNQNNNKIHTNSGSSSKSISDKANDIRSKW